MNSVYKLLIQITGKDKGATRELKKTKNAMKDLDNQAKALKSSMQLAGIAGMAFMAKQAVGAAWDLGKLGAAAIQQSDALDELARQAGGSADAIVAAMKKASGGTVAETDIILAANRGVLLGLGAQADQWEKLTEVARFRARAMGITTTQAVNDITTAIGRESKMIADNLGIIWDMDSIMQDYAQTLGKTAKELTQTERKQALLNDTLRIGQGQIADAGGMARTTADDFAELEAKIADLRTELAKEWAPIIIDVIVHVEEAVNTGDQLRMMSNAAGDAIAAFLTLDNATEAFNARMREQLGILPPAINLHEEWRLGVNLAATTVRGATDAHEEWRLEIYKLPDPLGEAEKAARLAAGAIEGVLGGVFQNSKPAALEYAEALYEVSTALEEVRKDAAAVSVDELGTGFAGAVGRIESQLAGLAGDVSFVALQDVRRRYVNEVDALFRELADVVADGTELTDFELEYRLNLIQSRFDEEVALLEGAGREVGRAVGDVSDAYADLRSAVESALQPTAVTAFDMELSELGEYVDKWDENARRLDAVAEGGFAAFDAHPDWVEILKIPDNVLAAGEAGLKAWAAQTADDVRSLFRPDLLVDNMDAAVAAVEAYLMNQAARELSLDLITQAVIDAGVVSGADAEKLVAQALGLDQTMVGETAGTEIFQGMIDKFSEKSAASEFAGYLSKDAIAQAGALKGAGYELWIATEVGILDAMEEGNYVIKWVELLLPHLLVALGSQGQWAGEGEP